ncbi:MAG: AAA family ATPase [Candidatus Spyradosoma sp.]
MSQPEENFTWIPFYRELARKLLDFRDDRTPLVTLIYENPQIAPATNYLHMRDGSRCADIDPFSFFGIFNRGISAQSRSAVLAELKKFFALDAALPRDFDGIPILDNRKSFYFRWESDAITRDSCDEIWAFFESMMRGNVDAARFSKILKRSGIGPAMLTMPMFWCAPDKFLPLDNKTRAFLKEQYEIEVPKREDMTFSKYAELLDLLKAKMASGEIKEQSFVEVSAKAWHTAKNEGADEMDAAAIDELGLMKTNTKAEPAGAVGKYVELLKRKMNLIFTGAPGTGKTFLSKEIAAAMGCTDAEIRKVQFHPSYDYTDFVEGLRPVADANGNVGFERRDGVFKEFCRKALLAQTVARANVFDGLNDNPTVWKVSLEGTGENPTRADCLKNGWIRIGWDGYGNVENFDEFDNFYLNPTGKSILSAFQNKMKIGDIVLSCWSSKEIDAVGIVTGDYEYRETGGTYPRYRTVKWLVKNIRENIVDLNGGKQMTLSTVYRMSLSLDDVRKIVEKYLPSNVPAGEARPFVFIIDEINRGELGKIFGELFGAIEPGYRGEKGRVQTQYQNLVPEGDVFGKGFFVPENVYIIGTMNDIDRSVESMDFAMRRRFAWEEITPEANAAAMFDANFPEFKDAALARMNALNAAIEKVHGLGRDYAIGPACFLPLKGENGDFGGLWKHHIAGTLREYLRGNPERDAILDDLEKSYNLANEA